MKIKLINTISEIKADEWNTLVGTSYPFISYEFLLALEQSGCVTPETGWLVQHLLVFANERLIACMPLYLKDHSRGEYVFDHQWAQTYAHYNINYFPKWVTAIPFTPCQNRRIFTLPNIDLNKVTKIILDFLQQYAVEFGVSSWHCLFPDQKQAELLQSFNLLLRNDVQFHWQNKGYRDFEDFLSTLTSQYRKKINRERRRIHELNIELETVRGTEISNSQLQTFYAFYLMTYQKKAMLPYLTGDFFFQLVALMPERLLFVFARKKKQYVGGALSFIGTETLYGRYWGCFEEYNSLHFETCYYQGIDYCIVHQLQKFDSGAQGEHKIARGFEPVTTYSAHWFKHSEFAYAIKKFLDQERTVIAKYKEEKYKFLPFKQQES